MEKKRKIKTLCRKEDWTEAVLWQMEGRDDELILEGKQSPIGFVCLPTIDSREEGFRWSRIWMEGDFPEKTMVRIRAYTSDTLEEEPGDFDWRVRNLLSEPDPYWSALELFGEPISEGVDFLVLSSGRYLRLMVELGNSEGKQVKIAAIRIQMAADHMTDYLPAIYRERGFGYRFLSIFDSLVSDLEQQIDAISSQLDLQRCSDEMLFYMASWLSLSPEADRKTLQSQIANALDDYEIRYSLEGVRQSIRTLTGKDAILIESQDVDPDSVEDGEYSKELRQLYGEDPFCFFVLMQETDFPGKQEMERFIEKMNRRIPAGVRMELVLLKNCIQLGWHSYLGINTALLDYETAMINSNTSIRYDTIIGGNR